MSNGEPLAERAGFEPAVALDHTAFRERHLKPLGHLSSAGKSKLAASIRRWELLVPLLVAVAAVALAGCGQQPTGTHHDSVRLSPTGSGPIVGGTLVVASGTESLVITGGAEPGAAGGVELAAGTGFRVKESGGGLVTVSAVDGQSHSRGLTIRLSSRRVWTLDLRGGATSMILSLRSLRVGAIDVSAGAYTMMFQLPTPRAAGVPVRVSGGATRITIEVPVGSPLEATVGPGYPPLTIAATSGSGQPRPAVTVEARGADRLYSIGSPASGIASYMVRLTAGAASVRLEETG